MSRYHSYLNSAVEILQRYRGEEPFASFLKKYFAANKKFGSKDRKQVSHLCYCYFRIGRMSAGIPVEERILLGLFLCSDEPNEILQQLKPAWSDNALLSYEEKLRLASRGESFEKIFPFANELSDGIHKEDFILAHLKQPAVFLRLRPGKGESVKQKLDKAGINYKIISDNCLALPGSSKVDTAIELNKEAIIQDYSSQRTGEFLQSAINNQQSKIKAWDCCAASGGKSIMLYDLYPTVDLTVSDIRESILINLKKRFREAGIVNYKAYPANLTSSGFRLPTSNFELILCDAPCTGSGTWSRTPEQLYYFKEEKIGEYAALQKKIVSNTIPQLQPGGYFVYITCSVFKKENEEVVKFMEEKFSLNLLKMETLKGYDKKADTMFAALLQLEK